ncbi:MAG: tRNA modification GTPase [Thermomicrobiales bacterium]|jgi:tRNA modification GTPase|nr:tRNA modification GTPase [Thermomicrobiales bacterium]
MDSATIAAIATPPGEGGVGMVRISGAEAAEIAGRVFRRGKRGTSPDLRETASHRLLYGRIVDPSSGETIDEALLGWMAAPHTYTREDTVELTCHGGPVPLQETLRVVLAAGARHAEPGEFTLRAFLNGRLDLAQAEAVLNVVSARTSDGLRLAIDDLAGDLSRRIRPARDAVVSLLAYLDAAADFPEDEVPASDVDADLAAAETALAEVVAGSRAGILYREGVQIALVGRPNVGKSSLLNALLRTERAIVTPIAGTTRDVIAESIDLRGIPATLLDTAGIAETADIVERLGIERSRRVLTAAAAAVLVLDGTVVPTAEDLAVARLLSERLADGGAGAAPVVVVVNKRDLPDRAPQDAVLALLPDSPVVELSSLTGVGIEALEDALGRLLRGEAVGQARPALITARQRAALDRALEHIRAAAVARRDGYPLDLLATDVRAALRSLGEVTGEAVDEAVLTEIFSRFCIGK